jgi:hypothetical protein
VQEEGSKQPEFTILTTSSIVHIFSTSMAPVLNVSKSWKH